MIAPFFFGDAVGAIATGRYAWTSPFALAVGAFAVALCAQIAAVFLTRETPTARFAPISALARFARRSPSGSWARPGAVRAPPSRQFFGALIGPAARLAIVAAMLLGIAVMRARRARAGTTLARIAVGAEALAVLAGWFGAQAPALVPGRYTLETSAASPRDAHAFLIAAACGAIVLCRRCSCCSPSSKARSGNANSQSSDI